MRRTVEQNCIILNELTDGSMDAWREARERKADIKQSEQAAKHAYRVIRSIENELKWRLARPHLKKIEPQIIESSPLDINSIPEIPNTPDIVE